MAIIKQNQSWSRFLLWSHPLTKFKIQKYFQSEPNFNGFYSGTNYVKIKNGGYLISLYEYKLESTH